MIKHLQKTGRFSRLTSSHIVRTVFCIPIVASFMVQQVVYVTDDNSIEPHLANSIQSTELTKALNQSQSADSIKLSPENIFDKNKLNLRTRIIDFDKVSINQETIQQTENLSEKETRFSENVNVDYIETKLLLPEDSATKDTTANITIEEALTKSNTTEEVSRYISFEEILSDTELVTPDTILINATTEIPEQFYIDTLPETLQPVIDGICMLEKEYSLSSITMLSILITEVGWDPVFSGINNWFNWSGDAINYQDFESTYACMLYTGERYNEIFLSEKWYNVFEVKSILNSNGYYNERGEYLTLRELNTMYAKYLDGSINWYWSDVVVDVYYSFCNKYNEWRKTNPQ